jgi:hypothetical protein
MNTQSSLDNTNAQPVNSIGFPSGVFRKDITAWLVFVNPSLSIKRQDGVFFAAVPQVRLSAARVENAYSMTALHASLAYPWPW